MSEALLCVNNGAVLVCQLVANNPETFLEGQIFSVGGFRRCIMQYHLLNLS